MNVFGGDNYAAECQGGCTGTCEKCALKRIDDGVLIDRWFYGDALIGHMVSAAFPGSYWRKAEPHGISYSFSVTLLDIAGGFRKFLDEWERDPRT